MSSLEQVKIDIFTSKPPNETTRPLFVTTDEFIEVDICWGETINVTQTYKQLA